MNLVARTPQQMGDALRRFRKLKQLTQRDISGQVGMRQATISSVENGDPGTRLKTLTEILRALNLELVLRERGKTRDVDLEDIFS